MRSLSVAAAALFAALLAFSVAPNAFANDMNAVLIPERDRAEGHYIAFKNITLRYPAGSAIAGELDGVDERVKFTLEGDGSSTDNGIASAVRAFNNGMIDSKSPAQVTNIELTYTSVIKGGPSSASMTFKIEATPQLERFVLNIDDEDRTNELVDLEWRAVHVTDPIVVDAPDIGELEINIPINLVREKYPAVAEMLEGSAAAPAFDQPIMNFEAFNVPMERWHFLFDPSGSLAEASSFFREESGAKVVSIYSLGESSFREGTFEAEEEDFTASIDGAEVSVHTQVPAPSGQIQISGFSKLQTAGGDDFAIVTKEAPEGTVTATGGFPIQVLLVFGGMMGAIAVFILWKTRK